MRKGTASGPFADSIDVWRAFALHAQKHTHTDNLYHPYFTAFTNLLRLILQNHLPTSIHNTFSANYFVAFHKDPKDLTRIRPLGIGTALRRLAGSLIMTIFHNEIVQYLLPDGQFGIAVPGGTDYVIHSTQSLIDQFLSDPTNSSRVILLLDLINMFNEVSRLACHDVLFTTISLAPIIRYFDLLYSHDNTCWIRTPTREWTHIIQADGFAQGDPLGPLFSALTLSKLLKQINTLLLERSTFRLNHHLQPNDDTLGSQSHTASIVDDTSIALPYADLPYFLEKFTELGRPLGIKLALAKTHILSSITGESPSTHLSPSDQYHLHRAIKFLSTDPWNTSPEITTGIRFLGYPLGSHAYAQQFLNTAITKFSTITTKFKTKLSSLQTKGQLFRSCAQPSVSYNLAADVYHNANISNLPQFNSWTSPFISQLTTLYNNFYQHLTSLTTPLTPLQLSLLYLPASLGGAGFRNPQHYAISSYIIPLIRSIRLATTGYTLYHSAGNRTYLTSITLPASLTTPLQNWESSTTKQFLLLHHYLPHLSEQFYCNPNQTFKIAMDFPLRGLSRILYYSYHETHLPELYTQSTLDTSPILSSLLNPLTSLALHSLPRHHPSNRLSNTNYSLLLRRKLRIPLFTTPIPPLCLCGKHLDPYGDHLFNCVRHSKLIFHDQFRDCLYSILRHVAPISSLTLSPDDIHLEPHPLVPAILQD
jgi:hypothetical protein